jgi:hypothetical protein
MATVTSRAPLSLNWSVWAVIVAVLVVLAAAMAFFVL